MRSVSAAYEKYRNRFGSNRNKFTQYCWLRCLESSQQLLEPTDFVKQALQLGIYRPNGELRPVNMSARYLTVMRHLSRLGLAKRIRFAKVVSCGRHSTHKTVHAYSATDYGKFWLRAYEQQVLDGEL